jgi:hypothetical protein
VAQFHETNILSRGGYVLPRRVFVSGLAGSLLSAGLYKKSFASATTGRCSRLALADSFEFNGSTLDASQIQARLSVFQQLGIGTIRTEVAWGNIETSQNVMSGLDNRYLMAAQAAGFKFKMRMATLGGAPNWLFSSYPAARLLNQAGQTSSYMVDPWFPGLAALLTQKADLVFKTLSDLGFMSSINYIVIDLGQAAEPIFPPAFVDGQNVIGTNSFWWYSSNARSAFITYAQQKYVTVSDANSAWGTSFSNWAAVNVPSPNQIVGAMWNDALTWYRNSKRTVVAQQVQIFRQMLSKYGTGHAIKLIILVPGQHLATTAWLNSVNSGGSDYNLEIMEDTQYLIDLARSTGCLLQYTSAQTLSELQFIQNYINAHGVGVPLFGENAGGDPSLSYSALADNVINEGLYGLDYVNSNDLFASDGITPTSAFANYKLMCQRLVNFWGVDM